MSKAEKKGLKHWLEISAFIATVLGVVVPFIIHFASSPVLHPKYCYVIDSAGQPPAEAEFAGNSIGKMSPVSDFGRFEVLDEWQAGSHISIFGGVQPNGKRKILGEGILALDGSDWKPICVIASTQEPRYGASLGSDLGR